MKEMIFRSEKGGKYFLNDESVDVSCMYHLSCLTRVFREILKENNVICGYVEKDSEEIIQLAEPQKSELFEELLKQCIEFRCNASVEKGECTIIRQLPIKVAISESNKLIALNKVHAIYKSVRGGYNIKVSGYENSSLDHYCDSDSRMWD